MLLVKEIKLPLGSDKSFAIEKALGSLRLNPASVAGAEIAKISVDARGGAPILVYTVAIELINASLEEKYLQSGKNISLKQASPLVINKSLKSMEKPPVVCGFGPAGLFSALLLAQYGLNPVIIERGSDVESRMAQIDGFNSGAPLNTESNVQFGEGGAGTFSDGKLTTRINDPLCDFVTQTLIRHGAPKEIAMRTKPHIGTDLLRDIIKSIRCEIIALGGTVMFNTRLTGIKTKQGALSAVLTDKGEIAASHLVLAIGHSARDTFKMLAQSGINLCCKPFSVGFRAEHLQSDIDKALYHSAAGHKDLPRGEYQLAQHVNGRGVYTFCMCPGGNVVAAASEENTVVVNGMSYHARSGNNANAAVVVNVYEKDFGGSPLKAIEFQQSLEQRAFIMGGKDYSAPAQNLQSFIDKTAQLKVTDVVPTYPRGVCKQDLSQLFGEELSGALRAGLTAFGRKIKCYTAPNAIITGVETRTSSPVRMNRSDCFESVDIKGIYPAGEGAGYAGGIMSAAVDGIRVAKSIIEQ